MKRRREAVKTHFGFQGWLLLTIGLFVVVHAGDNSRQLLGLRGGDAIQRNQQLVKSNKKQSLASNITVPLHGHSGTHHVHVYVGSPPQRQTLIVDTGSRVMAFACKPCRSCGNHASPYFDASLSTTHRVSKCGSCILEGISICSLFGDQCEISQKYTEGSSWSASEVEDIVWLGTPNVVESIEEHMQLAIPYAFGCQTSSNGLFQKQYADGILGLARHETSLVAAYYQAGAISRNAFSLCLTLEGGHMALGGSMPLRFHREPMQVTPITREHGWYSIGVTSVSVGDIVVTSTEYRTPLLDAVNRGKGCILDSGTTDTYLPLELAKKFGQAAMEWTNGFSDFSERSRQKLYTFAQFQQMPDIAFVLTNNVTLVMDPKNYMEGVPLANDQVQEWHGSKSLTNRVYLEELEGAVLGANAMFGYDILFDSQGHQVGIAKADCTAATIHPSIN